MGKWRIRVGGGGRKWKDPLLLRTQSSQHTAIAVVGSAWPCSSVQGEGVFPFSNSAKASSFFPFFFWNEGGGEMVAAAIVERVEEKGSSWLWRRRRPERGGGKGRRGECPSQPSQPLRLLSVGRPLFGLLAMVMRGGRKEEGIQSRRPLPLLPPHGAGGQE